MLAAGKSGPLFASMAANFATFAPYVRAAPLYSDFAHTYGLLRQAPPPDEQINTSERAPASSRFSRPWFPSQPSTSSSYGQTLSYQSGGVPALETSATTGFGSDDVVAASEDDPSNLWETRFGYRVDMLAAFAYILGPISGMGQSRTHTTLRFMSVQLSCFWPWKHIATTYAFMVRAPQLISKNSIVEALLQQRINPHCSPPHSSSCALPCRFYGFPGS
jgi:hypothetical protein